MAVTQDMQPMMRQQPIMGQQQMMMNTELNHHQIPEQNHNAAAAMEMIKQ